MIVTFKPEYYLSPELSPAPEFTKDMEAWFYSFIWKNHRRIPEFNIIKKIDTIDVRLNTAFLGSNRVHFYASVNGCEEFHWGVYEEHGKFIERYNEWAKFKGADVSIDDDLRTLTEIDNVDIGDTSHVDRYNARWAGYKMKQDISKKFKRFCDTYRQYLKLKNKFTKNYFTKN